MRMRVAHFPQVPCKAFTVDVTDIYEAVKVMDILADYDLWQLKHRIKPDFANAQVVEVFDENDKEDSPTGSWVSWCDEDTGEDDPRAYVENHPLIGRQ